MQDVFIGDIQGCADEFFALLKRLENRFGDDFRLWIVGDLVNRGPQNLRLLEFIRAFVEEGRARMVLGNHEIGLLAVAFGLREIRKTDTIADVLESSECDAWIDWLRRLPLLLVTRLGEQRAVMVHAAIPPRVELSALLDRAAAIEKRLGHEDRQVTKSLIAASPQEDADSDLLQYLTRCRSVARDGSWSSSPPEGSGQEPWHAAWSRSHSDYGVVYGHWALQGLHVAPGLRGLDTGCVHHGRDRDGYLTAWIPGQDKARPFDLPDDGFVQVCAHRPYFRDDACEPGSDAGGK